MAADVQLGEMDRRILVWCWARATTMNHTPRTDDFGHTCDELGCVLCNAGSEEEAAEWLVETYYREDKNEFPYVSGNLPDDTDLLLFAVEYLDNIHDLMGVER